MLEIGFVVRPWGEQHGQLRAIAARRKSHQRFAQGGKKARQMRHSQRLEQLRKNPLHDEPVFQGIASARGRLGTVGEYPPAPVRRAGQIGGVGVQVNTTGHLHSMGRTVKSAVSVDQMRRQVPFAQQCLGTVQISEDALEHLRPLDDALLDRLPLFGRYHHRQHVQIPRPVMALWIGVDVVSNANFPDLTLGRTKSITDLQRIGGDQFSVQAAPMDARTRRVFEQFVEARFGYRVAGKHVSPGNLCQRSIRAHASSGSPVRLRSRVNGYAGFRGSSRTNMVPGVWPNR